MQKYYKNRIFESEFEHGHVDRKPGQTFDFKRKTNLK